MLVIKSSAFAFILILKPFFRYIGALLALVVSVYIAFSTLRVSLKVPSVFIAIVLIIPVCPAIVSIESLLFSNFPVK